jgi:phosphatidylglycerophosphate synthase
MLDATMRQVKDSILLRLKKTPLFRLHPNTITTVSFLFGLASVVFLYYGFNKMAFVLFCLNRIIDGLDGLVARETGQQSDFGGYYDIMTDFIIYSLIPLALASRSGEKSIWTMTALLLAVYYINGASWMYLGGLLEKEKYRASKGDISTSIAMPNGLIEGTETIFLYSLMILLPLYHFWFITSMAILTSVGIPQRIYFAKKTLDP